jgi:NTE family protein
MKVDAVFEGGGVRGIAFLGAAEEMEKGGFEWENLAGTSAGSIIAALLSVGYNSQELKEIFLSFPFEKMEKKAGLNKVPVVGKWLSLNFFNGIYSSEVIESWLNMHLRKKGILTFADLPENKLKIIVTDLSQNRVSILPDDLPHYKIDPSSFSIALAVRMSCSIPFFFRPLMLSNNVIVDGGVLSNFPIWIFDTPGSPVRPTFGFRLSGTKILTQPKIIEGPIDLAVALVRTMMDAHDNRYIDSHSAARTIFIKDIHVATTHFNITLDEKLQLIGLGRRAVRDFISKWNFQKYIQQQRLAELNSASRRLS